MNNAPVALFAYRRPSHTRAAIEALLRNPEAIQTDLYVFSDAARDKSAEGPVREVRNYLKKVKGMRSISIIERARNFGLAKSIIDGVSRLCDSHGRVIVIEDDLLVAPSFLEYMNGALDRYRDNDAAMQVSGFMFPADFAYATDAIFMPFTTSWGWATWARAWKHFDPDMSAFKLLQEDKELRRSFNLDGAYDYFDLLEKQKAGQVDSWAIRWYLSVFMKKGLTLYPVQTLVQNIGFDGSGTHCSDANVSQSPIRAEFRVRVFPEKIEAHEEWRRVLMALPRQERGPRGLIRSMLSRARRLLGSGQRWQV